MPIPMTSRADDDRSRQIAIIVDALRIEFGAGAKGIAVQQAFSAKGASKETWEAVRDALSD